MGVLRNKTYTINDLLIYKWVYKWVNDPFNTSSRGSLNQVDSHHVLNGSCHVSWLGGGLKVDTRSPPINFCPVLAMTRFDICQVKKVRLL